MTKNLSKAGHCWPDAHLILRFGLWSVVKHKAYQAVFPRVRQTERISLIFMLTLNIHVYCLVNHPPYRWPRTYPRLLTGCAPEPAFRAVGVARAAVEAVRRPQLELADLNTTLRVKQSINAVLRIPGCLSRILIFYLSRIPDLTTAPKKRAQIFFCPAIFCSHKYHKFVKKKLFLNR